MRAIFVSDIHLSRDYLATYQHFLAFLVGPAQRTAELYILGDLFELWLGDDVLATSNEHDELLNALQQLNHLGVRVTVLPGNRDFLLRDQFAQAIAGQVLSDDEIVWHNQTMTCGLTHGDQLCTADTSYMDFRTVSRQASWQTWFLAKPVADRRAFAEKVKSQGSEDAKPPNITDVSHAAVEHWLRRHQYITLIHGHTHKPARHVYTLDGYTVDRWVLGQWHPHGGDYLAVHADSTIERHPFPASLNLA